MEEDKLNTFSKELEIRSDNVIFSMNKFHNLWCDIIYKDYTNNFEVFRKQKELHIAIYSDWREKSDTSQKIKQNLARVLGELRIAKALKTFDRDIISEMNHEIQVVLGYITDFIAVIDKYSIEHFVEKFKEHIEAEIEAQKTAAEAQQFIQKEKPETSIFKAFLIESKENALNFVSNKINISIPKIKPSACNKNATGEKSTAVPNRKAPATKIIEAKKLIEDLSKLSDESAMMNFIFKSFCRTVKDMISDVITENTKTFGPEHISNINAQIESMAKITQYVYNLFERIKQITSENERTTRTLVVKCSPCFFIKQ